MPPDDTLLQHALRLQGQALELHQAILETQQDRLAAAELRMHELQQAIQLLTTLVSRQALQVEVLLHFATRERQP